REQLGRASERESMAERVFAAQAEHRKWRGQLSRLARSPSRVVDGDARPSNVEPRDAAEETWVPAQRCEGVVELVDLELVARAHVRVDREGLVAERDVLLELLPRLPRQIEQRNVVAHPRAR